MIKVPGAKGFSAGWVNSVSLSFTYSPCKMQAKAGNKGSAAWQGSREQLPRVASQQASSLGGNNRAL
jgi:hypothetical protein